MSPLPPTRTAFPFSVQNIENAWIPLPDGAQLAARIWLPAGAAEQPVPAILEYLPYRKRDYTRLRDSLNHPYFAGHGYASVRVDIRGSGDSDGILLDEYLEQELADGEVVLRWIAAQPWCDGSVGMIGISWGGFNGLQLAARRPPELKAVISVCSTDDRYADDVHYMGGCLLGDNLSWASQMFAYNASPPDPELVGDRWRDLWIKRLDGSGLWLESWLRHQHRDDYWKHGSICEDFSAINCPVMAVGGWADGYSNAVFRLVENLHVPRKGLIGPWGHKYPHLGVPGPAIGFLQEAVRWWDQWLKNRDTGIMHEPTLRVWMQESVPPVTRYKKRPGHWVAEETWPSPNIRRKTYLLAPTGLAPASEEVPEISIPLQSPLTVGLFAGKWCCYTAAPDLPHDQREEDGGALVFETLPLQRPLEIMGAPEVELEVTSNQPVAMVAVRLSDVAPDQKATRITYGLLNLTHRDSHESPAHLEVGKRYRVQVQLNDIAHAFPEGHRLRLSISTSYWPLAWLPPKPVRLNIFTRASQLHLPVRNPQASDAALKPFAPPETAPPLVRTIIEPAVHNWKVTRDLETDESILKVIKDEGIILIDEIDLEIENKTFEWYRTRDDEFDSPRGETFSIRGFRRGDWWIKTETRTILESKAHNFLLHADIDAYENGKRIFCHSWDYVIPRAML